MSIKNWHQNYIDYMEYIANHSNYNGLAIERSQKTNKLNWITGKKTKIGQERIKWAKEKSIKMEIPIEPGYLAKVMFEVHPTKNKVCQICGETMSIKYIYPNYHFRNSIIKEFNYEPDVHESIYDIVDVIVSDSKDTLKFKKLLVDKLDLKSEDTNKTIEELIYFGEKKCRLGSKATFGPGAMSNFPDRFDGFHSYNRCCRKREDTGRHDENMRSYNKDRRAYEYLSDGNIHAANQFMNSSFFEGASADHIGPISLGFIHDPRYLQRMAQGDNSAKRDRLTKYDIDKLIEIENKTKINPTSRYANILWDYIKSEVTSGNYALTEFRNLLKYNINNYMEILWLILSNSKAGEPFLTTILMLPKKNYFEYDYLFDSSGNIISKTKRNRTEDTKKEFPRARRIAIQSIIDYHNKENRIRESFIADSIQSKLSTLYDLLNSCNNKINLLDFKSDNKKIINKAENLFLNIIEENQKIILSNFKNTGNI